MGARRAMRTDDTRLDARHAAQMSGMDRSVRSDGWTTVTYRYLVIKDLRLKPEMALDLLTSVLGPYMKKIITYSFLLGYPFHSPSPYVARP